MTISSGKREKVAEIASTAARDMLKELVKEAMREAKEEESSSGSSSGRGASGSLLLLGLGVALGYLASGKRPEIDEFLGDLDETLAELEDSLEETDGDELLGEVESELLGKETEEADEGGRKGPGLVVALLLVVALVSYLVKQKKGGADIDELIETEEVPIPDEDVDIGTQSGADDEDESDEDEE